MENIDFFEVVMAFSVVVIISVAVWAYHNPTARHEEGTVSTNQFVEIEEIKYEGEEGIFVYDRDTKVIYSLDPLYNADGSFLLYKGE